MFSEHAIGFLTDYLNLNEAQQAQAKEILAKERPTLDSLSQQMKQGHDALMQLETSGTFDEAKVRSVASQRAQTMTDLIVEKARIHSVVPDPDSGAENQDDPTHEQTRAWFHEAPPGTAESAT